MCISPPRRTRPGERLWPAISPRPTGSSPRADPPRHGRRTDRRAVRRTSSTCAGSSCRLPACALSTRPFRQTVDLRPRPSADYSNATVAGLGRICAGRAWMSPPRPRWKDRCQTAITAEEPPGERDRRIDPASRARDHLQPRLSRPQRVALRAGDPPRRRPRRARGLPDRPAPRLHRPPAGSAAGPEEPHLQSRPAGRLRGAAARGHLARPRRRARGAAAAAGGRPRHAARQDPAGEGRARPLQRDLRVLSTRASASPPASWRSGWSTTWSQHDPEFDFDAELERFIVRAERTAFGPSTQAIVDEAVSRDIPWIRLNTASLVQLGQGVHQKRIRATMTSQTLLDRRRHRQRQGAHAHAARPRPGCRSRAQSRCARSDDAVRLANRIGYPVVVKPLDGNHGRGVMPRPAQRRRRPRRLPDAPRTSRGAAG